ncbi:hypothetical protein SK128_017667, partial [Halocaridina rubra]
LSEEGDMRAAITAQHAAELAAERQERDESESNLQALKESTSKMKTDLENEITNQKEKISTLNQQLEIQYQKVGELEGRVAGLEAEVAGLAGEKLELE